MEAKTNIAAILKDKPKGTKLYNLLYNIDVELDTIVNTGAKTIVWCTDKIYDNDVCHRFYSEFGTIEGYPDGLQILFPSKEMRDWAKFSWKKGDLLINSCGFQCIFKEWASDDYTKFNGCYSNSRDGYEDVSNAETSNFVKLDNNTAYGYIRELEKRCGGVLNLKTLRIEKTNFKDGDVLFVKCNDSAFIEIFEYSKKNGDLYDHASLDITNQILDISGKYRISKDEITELRLATEAEKQQLFSALEKEGKAWDSEKKQIVDLKPKVDELKPFDKVLVRDGKDEIWEPAFFFRNLSQFNGYNYQTLGGEWRVYCVPYIGNESLLGTTKDVEG